MAGESFWTAEKEDALIDLWKAQPCLYDVTDREYINRNSKAKAVEELSHILGIEGTEVKRHINSLRTQFSRARKALPSGSGRVNRTQRQQWLLEKLDFLNQYIKKRNSTSNLQMSETSDSLSLENEDGISTPDEATLLSEDESSHDVLQQEIPLANDNLESQEQKATKRICKLPKPHRGSRERKELSILDDISMLIRRQTGAQEKPIEEEDDDSVFCKTLLREIRQIHDPYVKAMLRPVSFPK